jgi:2-polyprenyl-3-methyl-5-hydroxy-6-metoxy-1,4-benzoquinol methylase
MAVSELDRIMADISAKYPVEVVSLTIGARSLKVIQFKDLGAYIEKLVDAGPVACLDLPFWAKVWEASFVLAHFLGRQPVVPGRRILEIGAGIGLVGVYAALCGHDITITDNNDDALLFARAQVLLNDCPHVAVRHLDWRTPDLEQPYDVIVGADVVYDRSSYGDLVRFLKMALAPDGIIFLAKNEQFQATAFLSALTEHFEFKQTVQTIRSENRGERISLFAIRPKTPGPGR